MSHSWLPQAWPCGMRVGPHGSSRVVGDYREGAPYGIQTVTPTLCPQTW